MLRESFEADRKIYMKIKYKEVYGYILKEGIHKYPAPLEDPKLATGDEYDVSFRLSLQTYFPFKVQ